MNQDMATPITIPTHQPQHEAAFQNKFYFQNLFLLMSFTVKLIQAEENPPEELRTVYSGNAILFDRMVGQIYTSYMCIFTLYYMHIL